MDANYEETMAGKIVLSVGFFMHAKEALNAHRGCTDEQKIKLDELHLRKIDLAHEVLILNVGGYIGSSTKSELAYFPFAIEFLEPALGEKFMEEQRHSLGQLCAKHLLGCQLST